MVSGIVSEPLKIKNLFLNLSEINSNRCSKIKDILEKFYTIYFRIDASNTSIQNLTTLPTLNPKQEKKFSLPF